MKKIIIFGNNVFPFKIGGTEISIYEIILELLKKRGYEIYVFFSNVDSRHASSDRVFTGVHFLFNHRFKNILINKIARNIFTIINLLRTKPDVLLCFSFTDMSIHAILYSFLFKKRVITRTEGSDIHFFKSPFETFQKRFILRYSTRIICISKYHARILSFLNIKMQNKPLVLGNGSRFKVTQFSKKEDKVFEILFVGRLNQNKNVDTLVESIHLLFKKYNITSSDVKLKICGDGPLFTNLRNKVKQLNLQDSIQLLGNIKDYNTLFSLYKNADVFVLPSYYEGSPLVLFEALSFGCALICSRIPSLTNDLVERVNALFFNPYSKEDLADKVYNLISSRDLLNRIQKNNYEMSQKFTWNSIVNQIEKVFD
ncbi:MAG: glycosyltransferase family 1 protein [Promethearchaeota archaeon]|nr:MAG: glycosyltransferase family 1 protein [Candidatus Lokiarchaeota archaeon]